MNKTLIIGLALSLTLGASANANADGRSLCADEVGGIGRPCEDQRTFHKQATETAERQTRAIEKQARAMEREAARQTASSKYDEDLKAFACKTYGRC